MNPIAFGTTREPRVFAIIDRIGHFVVFVSRGIKPAARPGAWREYDPRKAETTRLEPATPAHLLGAGGRAEFFRLARPKNRNQANAAFFRSRLADMIRPRSSD